MISTANTLQMRLDWRPLVAPQAPSAKPRLAALASLTMGLAGSALAAQPMPAPEVQTAQTALPMTNPGQRLSAQYASVLGSADNAASLVQGLRMGRRIHLSDAGAQIEFIPPTRPMSWGDVEAALALASTSLAQLGITPSLAEHWSVALNGGTLNTPSGPVVLVGVLAQRASGLGWGQIAQAMGTTLGRVLNAHRPLGSAPDSG